MRRIMTTVVAAAMLASVAPVFGGTTGYTAVTVPGGSTVRVSVPYVNKAEGTYEVVTPGNLDVAESPFVEKNYSDVYYVRVLDGAAKGRWGTIASNNDDEIVLKDTSFMSDIAAGDKFKVIKHRTLGEVFPAALLGITFRASTLQQGPPPLYLPVISTTGTQVGLFADPTDPSVAVPPSKNVGPKENYVFANGAWRQLGDLGNSANDAILPPDLPLAIDNTTSTSKLTFIPNGNVSYTSKAVQLVQRSGDATDAPLAAGPVDITLGDLGLGGSSVFTSSSITTGPPPLFLTSWATFEDELLVFKNNPVGQETYRFADGHWRNIGSAGVIADNDVIPAGASIVIRKASGTAGSDIWIYNTLGN